MRHAGSRARDGGCRLPPSMGTDRHEPARPDHLAVATGASSPSPAIAPRCASSNSLPPTSATPTRAGLITGRRRNSWHGAQVPACRRSPPSSRWMSQPGSRRRRASWRRRRSSNGSRRCGTCSTGWSTARSCRSTRHTPCAGPGMLWCPGKRRCSTRPLLDSVDLESSVHLPWWQAHRAVNDCGAAAPVLPLHRDQRDRH